MFFCYNHLQVLFFWKGKMLSSISGFPRIGKFRELKFVSERYFRKKIPARRLFSAAKELRKERWLLQKRSGADLIASNDFSFYDRMLDTAVMLNIIPERYKSLKLDPIDVYFAMARGFQDKKTDVKALPMKKWFNTNYHYIVPEICDKTVIKLSATKAVEEFEEAKVLGIKTKPVIIGAFTLLMLSTFTQNKKADAFARETAEAYRALLAKLAKAGAEWVAFEEPFLVCDLTEKDINLFEYLYSQILPEKRNLKILCQTYFGDIRDCYTKTVSLPFDAIGLDFIEGEKSLELVKTYGFPREKILFAGIINGKNVWRNDYRASLSIIKELKKYAFKTAVGTSCSLLHVPFSLEDEQKLEPERKKHLSFAKEKLAELNDIKFLCLSEKPEKESVYKANRELFSGKRISPNQSVRARLQKLSEADFIRKPDFEQRRAAQKKALGLPLLPATTIGSFPQTQDVRKTRAAFKKGEITEEEYFLFNKNKIASCIKFQEEAGLDVLVHGEFERNDMAEYFAGRLDGFLLTEKAWVQSYGTRCVKPPVIWGDISRGKPMTVQYSSFAQSLTRRPVKGILTGPVTLLNWSFPREDIPLRESALQLALAIRDEVFDLESAGIRIIQIDEAALREKLPIRKALRHTQYLDWAIPAFRLAHSGVKKETQIHTHMCYSEFGDIIKEIDSMDADVITFEASRSNLSLIKTLKENNFKTETGPGVYDIHSPRVPSAREIKDALKIMLKYIPKEKLWVNPDCGLKTREPQETEKSIRNLVRAAAGLRESL